LTNAKIRQKKAEMVDKLEDIIGKSSVAVITEYKGVKTPEINALRNKLRANQMGFRIVKNTLARSAATDAGKAEVKSVFSGPIGMAYSYGPEVSAAAKVLLDHLTLTKSTMTVKGGFLGTRPMSAADVIALSKLPSHDVLIIKLMATLQSPIYRLVRTLNAPLSGLVTVLNARIKQLETK